VNKKRYQDVRAILEAGINVIGALNIQHLESLKDLVERATGVVIRETVPDSFLKEVDQVVNLDLAVEDLLERLRSGKIYAPDKVEGALKNFFKEQNLSALRELALREVAENVERMSDAKSKAGAEVARVPARVMVCMASNPGRAAALLRKGSRMAGRLNTDWFVVYVETPGERPGQISAEDQRELLANIESARGLGAEVIRLEAPSPVPALIDFARAHGVGHIVIGRSRQTWLRQLVGQSVPMRLLREADGFDLHIVSLDEGEADS
jgi:two-component system sensor histidine kinase KdpD